MSEAGHNGAWWCSRRERSVCPPEGCPKRLGCAREHGWTTGEPTPPAYLGLPAQSALAQADAIIAGAEKQA